MTRVAVSLWLVSALALLGCSSSNTGHVAGDMTVGNNDQAVNPDGASPGGGVLVITPPSVAFGTADCGGASPSPQAVTLSNTGSGAFTFVATLDNAQFYFAATPSGDTIDASGNLNGTIAAGASQIVSIGSLGVPASATAGLDLVGNLSVFVVPSGGVAQAPAPLQVPLAVTPFGVTVAVLPAPPSGSSVNYNFGQGPLGSPLPAPDGTVQLVNLGNDAVTVSLGTASDSEYSATVPAGSTLAAGANGSPGAALTVTAVFTANTISATQATVPITISPDAPICGQSATTLTLAGQGSSGNVIPTTTTVSWTPSCGTAAGGTGLGVKTVTLQNAVASPQPIAVSLASAGTGSPSGFTVSPSGATSIAASGQLVLTITPPAATSLNGIAPITDTLVIQYTDVAGNADEIPIALAVNPQGAILDLQLIGGDAPPLSFGVVPIGTSATAQLQIVNTGNLPATSATLVGSTTGKNSGTFSAPTGALTVPANNTAAPLTVTTTYTAPSALPSPQMAVNEAGQFTISDTTDVVCNTIVPLAAKATATTGAVTVAPQQLLFTGPGTGAGAGPYPGSNLAAPRAGTVYCNTQAAALTAQVVNYATTPATVTGWTFSNGTATSANYTVTMAPADGVMAAGGKVTLTVTPAAAPTALPADPDLGDTLTVAVQTSTDTESFPVQLVEVVSGAVLTRLTPSPAGDPSTSALAFGNTPAGSRSIIALDLINTGNINAVVSAVPIPSPTYGFAVPGNTTIVAGAGGAPSTFEALFQPPVSAAPGAVSAQSVLQTRATPLCDSSTGGAVLFPVDLALSGTVTKAAGFSITPNPISFTQPCGAAAGAAQKVTITATAKTTFSWTASVIDGSSNLPPGSFALSAASGGPVNTQATFTVSPVAIPSATTTTAPTYTATLQVVISAGSTMTTYSVPISETAQGVIIASTPTAITMSAPGFGPFSVSNAGSAINGVTFTAALGTASGANFTLQGPASNGGAQYYDVLAGAADKGVTSATDTVTVTVATPSNGNPPPVCNAGGALTIPVTATPRTTGPAGPGNP